TGRGAAPGAVPTCLVSTATARLPRAGRRGYQPGTNVARGPHASSQTPRARRTLSASCHAGEQRPLSCVSEAARAAPGRLGQPPCASSADPASRPAASQQPPRVRREVPMSDVAGELRARAESDGVEFFFAMFVDMNGKPCAKMVPIEALDVLMGGGAGFAGFA